MKIIPIYVQNGVPYIWNADDWLTLRQKHRIVGNLIGVTANYPRQDIFHGLPMVLSYEESCLLVEEGICELYECDESLTEHPDAQTKKCAKEAEKSIYEEQAEYLKKKRIEVLTNKMDIIAAGKQKHGSTMDPEQLLQQEIDKLAPLSRQHTLVQIPTKHPWPIKQKKISIEEWKVADSPTKLKSQVFKDLWRKGYFITDGDKFGGDFMVYPGDPVKFHAMYIVRCATGSLALKPKQIVAFGRLGVSVNKITVYACVNSKNDIKYQSLQWHESF